MKTATRKNAKTTKAHKTAAPADYIDTEGFELSDPDPELTPKQQAKKDKKEVQTLKQAKQTKPKEYTGSPIPCTRLFQRKMDQFKNCDATTLLAWNEKAETVTFLNVYNGRLPASYTAAPYTFTFNPKKHSQKIGEMEEIEVTDWPNFVVSAYGLPARQTRKSK